MKNTKTNEEIAQDIIEEVILEDIGNSKELNQAISKALSLKDQQHLEAIKEVIEVAKNDIQSAGKRLSKKDMDWYNCRFDYWQDKLDKLNKLK